MGSPLGDKKRQESSLSAAEQFSPLVALVDAYDPKDVSQPEQGPTDSIFKDSLEDISEGAKHSRRDSDEAFWSPKTPELRVRTSEVEDYMVSELTGPDSWKAWAAGRPLLVAAARNFTYILMWFFFSIALTMYNNELLGKKHGKFPAPLLMTTIHFFLQAVFAASLIKVKFAGVVISKQVSWADYLTKIVPTGIATAMDIGLSNLSLVLISVPLYEMCKSSAPVFLLMFAFLFRLERPSLKLAAVILLICAGEVLTVAGEGNKFNHIGFILVMLAAVMAGFRWTITQMLLQKEALGMTHPLVTLYYLAPVMAVSVCLCSIAVEPWAKLRSYPYFNTLPHAIRSTALMIVGACLAFFMILTEFLVISETSAVTFTVAGVVKEVATIVVSVIFQPKDHKFGTVNLAGLFVVFLGVALYNVYKFQAMREGKLGHHGNGGSSSSEDLLGGAGANYELLAKRREGVDVTIDDEAAVISPHRLSSGESGGTPRFLAKHKAGGISRQYSPRFTARVATGREGDEHDDLPGLLSREG